MKTENVDEDIKKHKILATLIRHTLQAHIKYYHGIMELYFNEDQTAKTVSIDIDGKPTELPLICLVELPKIPHLEQITLELKPDT